MYQCPLCDQFGSDKVSVAQHLRQFHLDWKNRLGYLEEDEEVKRRLLRKFVKSGKKIKSNVPLNQATYQNMIEYADRVGRIVRDPEFMRQISQDVTLHALESCRVRGFYASLTAAIVDKS